MTRATLVRASLAMVFSGAIFIATPQLEPPKLTIGKVKDNLYMIEGDGGNTGVFVTDEGAILVDDKFPRDVEFILEKVKSVTTQPVKYLLNTHHHGDHSGGNEKLLAQNVEIIAHRNARLNIVEKKQPGPGRLTFSDEFEIHLGGKQVRARYFGRSHTNGDAVIYFPDLKTIQTGDMFVRQAPFIDYSSGGSLIEWTQTIDKVLTLDFDTVIPGHGPVSSRADLLAFRKSIEELRTRMNGLSRKFDKPEDATAQLKLEDFGWTSNPAILNDSKASTPRCAAPPQDKSMKLPLLAFAAALTLAAQSRIIVIGAHPDDCDIGFAGTAAKLAAAGHKVKFLAVTNGDAGHQAMGGAMLAQRRRAEAMESGRRLGIAYEVLDNHDGELLPSLEVRMQIIRKIREWNADVVVSPRPNDYHPDHRYTGVLVQDAAYMVIVPNVASDTPPLKKNPLFLYLQDRFQRPNPFRPDIAISIDDVIDKKIDSLDAQESQFYEWLPWTDGTLDQVPKDKVERKVWLKQRFERRTPTPAIRAALIKWYGQEKGAQIKLAEAFEVCEYGRQPNEAELRALLPIIGK